MPPFAAAYMSQATGSQFPLFPWLGFTLLGAGLGQLYARWSASDLAAFAQRALIAPGVILVTAGNLLKAREAAIFGAGPGTFVPAEVMLRIGACLIILAAFAHLSRHIVRLPHIFGAVAQESLLIYFVHLCIVYGSVWNPGLIQLYGATRTPGQTVVLVVVVVRAVFVVLAVIVVLFGRRSARGVGRQHPCGEQLCAALAVRRRSALGRRPVATAGGPSAP